ncbi:MAG: hypothetical protein M1812_006985 [Candelaria pacifica]|nr:MAG: hypothetical protein M1812_006985 [Candelaria pacifica]
MAASLTSLSSLAYTLNYSYEPSIEPYFVHIFFGDAPKHIDFEQAYEASSWVGQICVTAQPHNNGDLSKGARLQSSMPVTRHLLKHLHVSTPAELTPDMVERFVREDMQWRCVGASAGNRKEIPRENLKGELSIVLCGSDSVLWRSSI